MTFPTDPKARKALPICTGVLDYFPDAIAAVAAVSKAGNDQHNPGEPMHWARGKSMDQADTLVRHLMERGQVDTDGHRHSAKAAWRALALLQLEIEAAEGLPASRASTPAEPAGEEVEDCHLCLSVCETHTPPEAKFCWRCELPLRPADFSDRLCASCRDYKGAPELKCERCMALMETHDLGKLCPACVHKRTIIGGA